MCFAYGRHKRPGKQIRSVLLLLLNICVRKYVCIYKVVSKYNTCSVYACLHDSYYILWLVSEKPKAL